MSKITYTNKQEATDPNNPIDPIEKFKFEDANEIKTSVNELYDTTIKVGDNTVVNNTGFKLIDDNYNSQIFPAAFLIKSANNMFQGQISKEGILWNNNDEGTSLTLVPGQINISPASGAFAGMNAYGGFSFTGGGNSGFLSPGGLSGSNANSNYSMNSSVTQGTNPSGNYTHTYGVVNGTSADAATAFTLTPEALTLTLGGIPKIISYTALPELPEEAIEFLLPNIGGTLLTDATTAFIKNGPEVAQDGNININGNINLNSVGYIDNVTGINVRGDGNISTPNIGAAAANIDFLKVANAMFDVNSQSESNTIDFLEATPEGEARTYSHLTTSNGGFQFSNAAGTDLVKIGYDGKLSLGNKSITIGTEVGSNQDFALPEVGGTLLTDADLGSYLQNYDTGDTVLNLTNASLHIKAVAGEAFFDPTSLVMYPATGGDIHLSQNSIGFNKNGGDTSFSADEFKILFKPVWNKSATLKISDTATGIQEYILPEVSGTLATLDDIPGPNVGTIGTYIQGDGVATTFDINATAFPLRYGVIANVNSFIPNYVTTTATDTSGTLAENFVRVNFETAPANGISIAVTLFLAVTPFPA